MCWEVLWGVSVYTGHGLSVWVTEAMSSLLVFIFLFSCSIYKGMCVCWMVISVCWVLFSWGLFSLLFWSVIVIYCFGVSLLPFLCGLVWKIGILSVCVCVCVCIYVFVIIIMSASVCHLFCVPIFSLLLSFMSLPIIPYQCIFFYWFI